MRYQLFTLPFAGGSSYSYNGLKPYLADGIEFVPLDLAGHGRRLREPLLSDMQLIAKDLFQQVQQRMTDKPFAFYGHSMGALLSYLVTVQLAQLQQPLPVYFFLSGCAAPPLIRPVTYRDQLASQLGREDFVKVLAELGGCPPEILNDPHLVEFFEPVLRADFRAVDTYRFVSVAPLPVPLRLWCGDEDKRASEEAMLQWQQVVSVPLVAEVLNGGHFFIFEHFPRIGRDISDALAAR